MRTFTAAAGTSILAAGFGAAALAPAPVVGSTNQTTPPMTTACDYPADVLDLTSWKVQLPIGEDESPDEIEQPELATYEIDPWFTPTPNCDAVQFRAAVDGYFKAGAYTQANCENSSPCSIDNYGEVIVYDVGLNHSDAVTRYRS